MSWTPNRASQPRLNAKEIVGLCQVTDERNRDDSVRVLQRSNIGLLFPLPPPYLPAMSSRIRPAMKTPRRRNAKDTPAELAKRMSRRWRVDVERCLRGGWCHQFTHL